MDYGVTIGIRDLYTSAINAMQNRTVAVVANIQNRFNGIRTTGAVSSINSLKAKLDDLFQQQGNATGLRSLQAINRQIRDTENQLNRLQNAGTEGNMFTKLKQDMLSFPGAALITNPIVAVTGAIVSATSMAMDFEKGMAQVNATAQLSKPALGELQNKLIAMGETSNVELGNMPQAFNKVLSAVGDVDKSMIIFEQTLKASKAGFTDVNVTADAITNVLGSAGLGADKAGYAYDVLFKTMKTGKAEFQDIAGYLPKILPAAMQAGVGFEQIAGAFAYMTTKGQSVEQTTTLLQNAMKALTNPERIQDFQKLGVNIFDVSGKMRPLVDVSADLNKQLIGLTDQQKAEKLAKLGLDTEAANAFALLAQDTKSLGSIIGETSNASGEMAKTLELTANTSDDMTSAMNKFKAVAIKLGTAVIPIFSSALTFLSPVVGAIGSALEFVTQHANTLIPVVGILGGAWVAYTLWTSGAAIATGFFSAAVGLLTTLMLMNPVGLLVAGIAALVAGLVIAYKESETFRGIVDGVFSAIGVAIDVVVSKVKGFIDGIKEGLQWMGILNEETPKAGAQPQQNMMGRYASDQKNAIDSKAVVDGLMGVNLKVEEKKATAMQPIAGKAFAFEDKKAKTAGAPKDHLKMGTGGVEGDAKQAKNITVKIEKLVETLMVNASNLAESGSKIREEVAKALIDAVRDFELQAG